MSWPVAIWNLGGRGVIGQKFQIWAGRFPLVWLSSFPSLEPSTHSKAGSSLAQFGPVIKGSVVRHAYLTYVPHREATVPSTWLLLWASPPGRRHFERPGLLRLVSQNTSKGRKVWAHNLHSWGALREATKVSRASRNWTKLCLPQILMWKPEPLMWLCLEIRPIRM